MNCVDRIFIRYFFYLYLFSFFKKKSCRFSCFSYLWLVVKHRKVRIRMYVFPWISPFHLTEVIATLRIFLKSIWKYMAGISSNIWTKHPIKIAIVTAKKPLLKMDIGKQKDHWLQFFKEITLHIISHQRIISCLECMFSPSFSSFFLLDILVFFTKIPTLLHFILNVLTCFNRPKPFFRPWIKNLRTQPSRHLLVQSQQ